ncbi:MAG TPA: hypothetical protein ENI55_04080 [Alphaproteobacteria bacterium]|nr:hypothetical protein [Alphaproteobacteria bacterium]
MILNMLGGIVSGIWLAVLGDWWAIGYGVAGLFLSHFFLATLLMPGMLISVPAMILLDKGKTLLGVPLILLGNIYTVAIMSGWCLGIFIFFMTRADSDNYIPLLLWSYGAALGPWIYMAQKEQQSGASGGEVISIFFAEVAYIIIALMIVFTRANLFGLGIVFIGIMGIGLLFQFGTAFAMAREQKRMGLL